MPGPFNRSWTRYTQIAGYTRPREEYTLTWMTSDRLDGKLVLRGNEMSLSHRQNTSHSERYDPNWGPVLVPLYGHISVNPDDWKAVRERALAVWYSELKGDSAASLGVTVGSWNQSWSMIAKRYGQISRIVRDTAQKSIKRTVVIEKRYAETLKRIDNRMKDLHFRLYALTSRDDLWKRPADVRRLKRLIKAEERKRLKAKDTLRRDLEKASSANLFLEGVFGWMPLIQDIINTAKTLTGDNFPAGYISGSGRGVFSVPTSTLTPDTLTVVGGSIQLRSKYTAQVSVQNPNVWLANQLGLLNPAVVAWDLIPWSWVVGMFVNVQSILESFTTLYGLSVTDITRTDQSRIVSAVVMENAYPEDHPGYARSSASATDRFKARVKLDGIPTPSLTLRMPKLSMKLGLIAAATTTVQVAKLSRTQSN